MATQVVKLAIAAAASLALPGAARAADAPLPGSVPYTSVHGDFRAVVPDGWRVMHDREGKAYAESAFGHPLDGHILAIVWIARMTHVKSPYGTFGFTGPDDFASMVPSRLFEVGSKRQLPDATVNGRTVRRFAGRTDPCQDVMPPCENVERLWAPWGRKLGNAARRRVLDAAEHAYAIVEVEGGYYVLTYLAPRGQYQKHLAFHEQLVSTFEPLTKGGLADATPLAARMAVETPAARLRQLVEELRANPSDDALREKVIRNALAMNPTPALPEEAERFVGRAVYAFKSAKREQDFLDAAREYLKAIDAAPWVGSHYHDLCLVLESAKRPREALRACKLFLASADAQSPDAAAARKRIAGLEYALERESGAAALRKTCLEFESLFRRGAKVARVHRREVTVKLVTAFVGGAPRNQVLVFDIERTSDPHGRVFDVGPIQETFRIDDRVAGTPSSRLTIDREGRIAFGSTASAQAEITTTVAELHELRNEQLRTCALVERNGKTYVELGQAGPIRSAAGAYVAGKTYYAADCVGNLAGEKPGWMPEVFIPYEEINRDHGFKRASNGCAGASREDLGWLASAPAGPPRPQPATGDIGVESLLR